MPFEAGPGDSNRKMNSVARPSHRNSSTKRLSASRGMCLEPRRSRHAETLSSSDPCGGRCRLYCSGRLRALARVPVARCEPVVHRARHERGAAAAGVQRGGARPAAGAQRRLAVARGYAPPRLRRVRTQGGLARPLGVLPASERPIFSRSRLGVPPDPSDTRHGPTVFIMWKGVVDRPWFAQRPKVGFLC